VTESRAGRPRSAEADRAIMRATLELLADEGLQGLSVEGVAAKAGVGKTTIYRRYPGKRELVGAALASVLGEGGVPPDTGSVRGDLQAIAKVRLASLRRTRGHILMPRLLVDSAHDPELHRLIRRAFVDPGREAAKVVLLRGVERGELRPDLDLELAVDLLHGSFVYRLLISRSDLRASAHVPERAIDLVLEGALQRAGGGTRSKSSASIATKPGAASEPPA
jgi:AcrR family transcriptional regulator